MMGPNTIEKRRKGMRREIWQSILHLDKKGERCLTLYLKYNAFVIFQIANTIILKIIDLLGQAIQKECVFRGYALKLRLLLELF
jgi:hypothetical protein